MKTKKVFAFDRMNFILLAIGIAIVIVGLLLMSGSGTTEEQFNPAIFDARHIKVAPVVCLFGYLFMVYAILRRPRDKKNENETEETK
jgi:membrane-bound ClpP family serine protease